MAKADALHQKFEIFQTLRRSLFAIDAADLWKIGEDEDMMLLILCVL